MYLYRYSRHYDTEVNKGQSLRMLFPKDLLRFDICTGMFYVLGQVVCRLAMLL